MTGPPITTGARRRLLSALGRGFIGRCPACGRGAVLIGYSAPAPRCTACGESLAQYQAADFAPYLVTFFVGLIFTPLTVALALSGKVDVMMMTMLMSAAVVTALLLLPRAKGAAIALLWALDVHNA